MKTIFGKLALCALLGTASGVHADTTVTVDSSETWNGYMKWYDLPVNGGAYVSGGVWTVADLKAEFSGGSLTLKACPINNPDSPYWYVTPGGPGVAGNKQMEALMYIEKTGPLAGQAVTFSGTVQANSWVSGYNTVAFIEDFAPDYSSSVLQTVPLTTGAFSVTLSTNADPGRHVQYGFRTFGANVWPTDVDSKGSIQIQDVPPPFVPDEIPNGDFEIAGGVDWATETVGPAITFPTTLGNPSGNAVIDATVTEGFAAIKAFGGAQKTFASLGLSPGDTCTVQMDMKILEGSNIGGLRLVGPAGYEYLNRPTIIGDGTSWETYSIEYTVPAAPTEAIFTLVWGFNSKVAFDNVAIVLPTPAAAPQPSILIGETLSWTPTVVDNYYQPQESADNSVWTDLGPASLGTTVSSVFDPTPAPFYRVQESAPVSEDVVFNGGFEEPFIVDEWIFFGQFPEQISTDAHTGSNSVKILATGSVGMGAVSGLEQNTTNAMNDYNPGGPLIAAGQSYDLSFWAKNNTYGDGYLQRYIVNWLDGTGAIVPGGGTNQTFPNTSGAWVQVVKTGLVAPAGAVSAQVLIQGEAGAFPESTGEVLIDDVALVTTASGAPTTIASSSAATAEISWQSVAGQSYQLRSSTDLSGWSPLGGSINGNGNIQKVYDTPLVTKKFYQLGTE